MKNWKAMLFAGGALLLAACGNTTSQTTTTAKNTLWQDIQAKGTLTVSTPGSLYPTSYHNDNNELTGYEIEMMNEIGKRLGVNVAYTEIGVAEAFTAVDSGQVDISMNNFDITKDRQEKYNLSEPYKYAIGGMIVREDGSSNITAKDLSDWKGKRAGGGAGTQYMKITEKLGGIPVLYDNVTNDVYLRDVSTGRTDFIPNDYYTQVIALKLILEKFPDIHVKMGDVKYNPTQQALVMKKDDNSLKEKVDEAIKAMKEDGTLKTISEKYYLGQDLSKPQEDVSSYPVVDVSDVK